MNTITISLNTILQPSDSKILSMFKNGFPALQFLSVERSPFSDRFAITFNNPALVSKDEIVRNALRLMQDKGYNGEILALDTGNTSSRPGGVEGAIKNTADSAAKILLPIAIIVAIGGYFFLKR